MAHFAPNILSSIIIPTVKLWIVSAAMKSSARFVLSPLCILFWATIVSCKFKAHPFGNGLADRADDILESLRENMELEISDKSLIHDIESTPHSKLYLSNLEAVPFSVKVRPTETNEINQDYLYDVNELSAQLEGSCATLAADWWNYEWCHR